MNLGYACINMTLGSQKPKVTTNRSMIKRTFLERGVEYAGELGLQNSRDLFTILEWNNQNNIKCFRLSSEMFQGLVFLHSKFGQLSFWNNLKHSNLF